MSYSVRSNFVPVEWLLADLWPLNLYFCSNVKLSGLFLDVLWYIDLIFGIWLYLDELQFKLEFCSGRMIFGWVMALELVFFVQIWSWPDFSLTSFDILTWYLVSGYIGMSYSVHSNFVPVEWLLAELWPSNLYILFKFEVVRTFLWRPLIYWLDIWYVAISRWVTVKFEFRSGRMTMADLWPLNLYFCSNVKLSGLFLDVLWYIDLIFGIWLYLDELQFNLEFCSGRMIFGWVMALELVFFVQILSCLDFFFTSFDILTWYFVCGYI